MTAPFDPIDDVGFVPVDTIAMGERLRPVDLSWATALGQVMLRDGQRSPIEIARNPSEDAEQPWLLVSGAHRLRGAQLAGIEAIKAIEISPSENERRIAEISENLFRRDLDPVDRAGFIAELVEHRKLRAGIKPDVRGQALVATLRWKKAVASEAGDAAETISAAYGFTDELADTIGLTTRTLRNDMLLHRRLPASIRTDLAGSPVLRNATQLRALAKLEAEQQSAVIRQLQAGAKTVAEAIERFNPKRTVAPEEKRLSAFLGAWGRMSVGERKGALAAIAEQLPAGWSLSGLRS